MFNFCISVKIKMISLYKNSKMEGKKMENNTYNMNMIKKFIFRIDFISEIENLKESIPSNITTKIVSNFPNSIMADVVESEIQIKNDLIEKKDRPFKQWEYISTDNSNKIVITPKFLLYDCSKYISFEDVLSKFLSIIEEMMKFDNVQIGRVCLRYINIFETTEFNINNISDWEHYFASELFSFSRFGSDQQNITNMVNSIEFSFPGFRLKYKSGFNNKNYPLIINKPDFTIDCDGYSNAVIITFDDLKTMINSIHDEIEKVFEKSITEDMREKLNG